MRAATSRLKPIGIGYLKRTRKMSSLAATTLLRSEAYQIKDLRDFSNSDLRVMLTCEHANGSLPRPYVWPDADKWIEQTHWSYDPGASECADELLRLLGGVAVYSCYSRLLVDCNRPLGSDSLFRNNADGGPVELNMHMTQNDVDHRLMNYWLPFHVALGRVANIWNPSLILSVNSFSPVYETSVRDFDIGALRVGLGLLHLRCTLSWQPNSQSLTATLV